MDLKNLISRIDRRRASASATDSRQAVERGLFPQPKLTLSDGVILYDRDEVRRAIEERKRRRTLGT